MAQCYLGRPGEIPPGIQTVPKLLADFRRVSLKAGEENTVRFTLPRRCFQYYDKTTQTFQTFTGARQVLIGASSRDIRLTAEVRV